MHGDGLTEYIITSFYISYLQVTQGYRSSKTHVHIKNIEIWDEYLCQITATFASLMSIILEVSM